MRLKACQHRIREVVRDRPGEEKRRQQDKRKNDVAGNDGFFHSRSFGEGLAVGNGSAERRDDFRKVVIEKPLHNLRKRGFIALDMQDGLPVRKPDLPGARAAPETRFRSRRRVP